MTERALRFPSLRHAIDAVARARQEHPQLIDTATSVGLWVAFGALVIWSAIEARDFLVTGVIFGSIVALGAIGLTLIYGILKFAHFAHGDLMMFGAYLAFFVLTGKIVGERAPTELGWSLDHLPGAANQLGPLSFGYGFLLAMLVALVAMVAVAIGLDRFIYRPLRRRGSGIVIFAIASLGLAIAVRSLMLIVWGSDPRFFIEGIYPAREFPLGITLKPDQIFIFATAIGLAILVYLLLFRTRIGKAMRATADNPELARVSGIDTERVIMWTWGIGGALMAVAGVLLALQAQLKPELGFVLLLPLFAATILGGIGSPQGAFAGAMIVGIAQEVFVGSDRLFPGDVPFFGEPGYKFAVAFIILILILLVRPHGLFGAKT